MITDKVYMRYFFLTLEVEVREELVVEGIVDEAIEENVEEEVKEYIYKTGDRLRGNPRIVKFDPATFWMTYLKAPNPSYRSVEELAKKDERFKKFKRRANPETVLLLMQSENIIQIKDLVYQSDYDNSQAGRMLLHLMEGSKKSKIFSGVHHLPSPLPDYILNFKVVTPPNEYGVYKATFDIKHNGKVLRKEEGSTLFPQDWTPQRVYDECLFALERKVRVEGEGIVYRAMTHCGILVQMHFGINEKGKEIIHTLYPLM